MIAALYVDTARGPYARMRGVECWGYATRDGRQLDALAPTRDARDYAGPWPVVPAVRTAHAAWVLPWAALGPQWWAWFGADGRAAAGTASLSSDDLDRLGRRMPRPGDWLPVLA